MDMTTTLKTDAPYTSADEDEWMAYAVEHFMTPSTTRLLALSDAGIQRIFEYDLGAILNKVAGKAIDKRRTALTALIEHLDAGRINGLTHYDVQAQSGSVVGICATAVGYPIARLSDWVTLTHEVEIVAHGECLWLAVEHALMTVAIDKTLDGARVLSALHAAAEALLKRLESAVR